MSQNLLILGASARAAAWSARQAGFSVVAADLFADLDLRGMCEVRRVTDYPAQLAEIASQAPPGAWLYTGGLENHPALIDRIAKTRVLWGNAGPVLRKVRNPRIVAQVLNAAGINAPRVSRTARELPRNGTWLRKPIRSCGGRGICFLRPTSVFPRDRSESYYQQHIDGAPCSAVYVAAAGNAVLLGVTRQLVGACWAGADGFLYAGSCGPLKIGEREQEQWQRIGQCLSGSFGLCGLFGVDAVWSQGTIWPVEVNPRYAASMEVIERGLAISAIQLHADACHGGKLPHAVPTSSYAHHGKAIFYARDDVYITDRFVAHVAAIKQAGGNWTVADIPHAGEFVMRGHPVATVLVEAENSRQVEAMLRRCVRDLYRLLESRSD